MIHLVLGASILELCPELHEELVLLANEQSEQVEEGIGKGKIM
jgi:hypothetical protein